MVNTKYNGIPSRKGINAKKSINFTLDFMHICPKATIGAFNGQQNELNPPFPLLLNLFNGAFQGTKEKI